MSAQIFRHQDRDRFLCTTKTFFRMAEQSFTEPLEGQLATRLVNELLNQRTQIKSVGSRAEESRSVRSILHRVDKCEELAILVVFSLVQV